MGGGNTVEEVEVNTSLDSFNGSSLLGNEEFELDLHDLIKENSTIPLMNSNSMEDSGNYDDINDKLYEVPTMSPVKKNTHKPRHNDKLDGYKLSLDSPNLFLKPNSTDTNVVSNGLFQVTNQHNGSQSLRFNMFGLQEDDNDDLFSGKRLNNDKINKLVNDLGLKNNGDDCDYELDDQMRTGVFKGRFKKHHYNSENNNDELDTLLTGYLDNGSGPSNENKENLSPYPDPLKTIRNKDTNSIKKSNKVFFKAPRRNGSGKSSIPVLKPLSNVTNIDIKKPNDFVVRKDNAKSPKRICTPNHINNEPSKPSLKYQDPHLNIYIVDSLTGHINDATQFGTELNASNCEGFPLPEHVNEIVQIPTNDETQKVVSKKQKQKMAIIKAFHNKYYSTQTHIAPTNQRLGFYSKSEFDNYKHFLTEQTQSGVEVVNQTPIPHMQNLTNQSNSDNFSPKHNKNSTKQKVRWADKLEW